MATTFTTSSSSPWSCLSEVSTTGLLPIHNSRVEFLKKRFSGIINKAQLTLGGKEQTLPNNNENDGNMKNNNNNNNAVRPAAAAAADCRNRNRNEVLKRERSGCYKTLIRGQEQNNNENNGNIKKNNNNVVRPAAAADCRNRNRNEVLKRERNGCYNTLIGGQEQSNNENNGNIKKKNNNNVVRPAAAAADCRNRNRNEVLKRERNGCYKTLIRGEEQNNNNNNKCCGDADNVEKRRNKDDVPDLEREKIKMRKMEIQKMREAARKEIEEMRNDSGICDPQEVMREFAKLIGYDTATGVELYGLKTPHHFCNAREVEEGEIVE